MKLGKNITLRNEAGKDIMVIDVLGEIGLDWWTGEGFTKEKVLNELKGKKPSEVHLNISSLGGDYGEALAIKTLVQQTKATVKVHYFGLVASAATEIGNAASKSNTTISSDAFFLIHNTSSWAGGNKEEILKTYQTLEKLDEGLAKNYAAKSGLKTAEEFAAKMKEDQFMNAAETLEWGLVGAILPAQPVEASLYNALRNTAGADRLKIPAAFKPAINKPQNSTMAKKPKELVAGFLNSIKNLGLKIVADGDTKPEDVTAALIKAVEDSEETPPAGETVTNAVDYTATVTEEVSSIELEDESTLSLANAPYAVSADGASSLQTDLTDALNGTAETVTVTFNEDDTSLTIEVKGSSVALATVNGSIAFTTTGEEAEEEPVEDAGEETPENLQAQLAEVKNKISAAKEKKQPVKPKVLNAEVAKLKAELAAANAELDKIKTGKSGGKTNGKTPKINDKATQSNPDIAPGEAAMLKAFENRTKGK